MELDLLLAILSKHYHQIDSILLHYSGTMLLRKEVISRTFDTATLLRLHLIINPTFVLLRLDAFGVVNSHGVTGVYMLGNVFTAVC